MAEGPEVMKARAIPELQTKRLNVMLPIPAWTGRHTIELRHQGKEGVSINLVMRPHRQQ